MAPIWWLSAQKRLEAPSKSPLIFMKGSISDLNFVRVFGPWSLGLASSLLVANPLVLVCGVMFPLNAPLVTNSPKAGMWQGNLPARERYTEDVAEIASVILTVRILASSPVGPEIKQWSFTFRLEPESHW